MVELVRSFVFLALAIGARTASAQEQSAEAQPSRAEDETAEPAGARPRDSVSPSPTPSASNTAAGFASFGSQPASDEVPGEADEPASRASVVVATRTSPEREWWISRGGEADCDGPPRQSDAARCSTPHEGGVSGNFVGAGIGYLRPRSNAGSRAAVGSGWTSHVQLGLEFYDQVLLNVAFGGYVLSGTRSCRPSFDSPSAGRTAPLLHS